MLSTGNAFIQSPGNSYFNINAPDGFIPAFSTPPHSPLLLMQVLYIYIYTNVHIFLSQGWCFFNKCKGGIFLIWLGIWVATGKKNTHSQGTTSFRWQPLIFTGIIILWLIEKRQICLRTESRKCREEMVLWKWQWSSQDLFSSWGWDGSVWWRVWGLQRDLYGLPHELGTWWSAGQKQVFCRYRWHSVTQSEGNSRSPFLCTVHHDTWQTSSSGNTEGWLFHSELHWPWLEWHLSIGVWDTQLQGPVVVQSSAAQFVSTYTGINAKYLTWEQPVRPEANCKSLM